MHQMILRTSVTTQSDCLIIQRLRQSIEKRFGTVSMSSGRMVSEQSVVSNSRCFSGIQARTTWYVIGYVFENFKAGAGTLILLAVSSTGCAQRVHLFESLHIAKQKSRQCLLFVLAEGKGFEPLWACTQTVFKTASL